MDKIKSRKFLALTTPSTLALVNQAAGVGIDWKITVAMIVAGGLYAIGEGLADLARTKKK